MRLGDDEHRADQQADEVVDEGRLLAFVAMADELDHPADHEDADAPDQPARQVPSATLWAAAAARRRAVARPSTRLPRVRNQAAAGANTIRPA